MDSELEDRGRLSVSGSFDEKTGRDGGCKSAARPKLLSEIFEEVFPYYLAMGMTPEQFWDGDVWLVRDFRRARKIRVDEANQMAWLQGLYIYQAIGNLSPALKAFAKGKPKPYPKKPFDLAGDENEESDMEQGKDGQKEADDKFSAYMMAWMTSVNNSMASKQQEGCGGENGGQRGDN